MCIPEAPGNFSLHLPVNETTYSINPPLTLSWSEPSPIGQSCNGDGPLSYRIYLEQVNPPSFFADTSETSINVQTLSPGIWYWTVKATNSIYQTWASGTNQFLVLFFVFCTHILRYAFQVALIPQS